EAGARTAEYLAVNPNGRLPAIEDDGFVLWESLAITLYLAKKHSVGRLYPADLRDEAKTWQWSLWALNEVDRGVNIWSLHAVRLPPEDRDPQNLAEALKVIAKPFGVLDAALAERPYLVGDDFTVADLNVAAVISRAIDMDLAATPGRHPRAELASRAAPAAGPGAAPRPRPPGGAGGAPPARGVRRRLAARR